MTDLDVQANTPSEYNNLIARLKSGLKISRAGRENIYTISIMDKNPEMAKNIVQATLTVFIENTLGETRNDSDAAQKFLNTQIQEYENRLVAAEARVTDFTRKYSDILPQSGGYYQRLSSSKEKLKVLKLEILELNTRLKAAQKQLKIDAIPGDNLVNKIQDENTIQTTYDSRIAELEASIDALKLRFTDAHPEIKEASRRLEYLSTQRKEEIEKYYNAFENNKDGYNAPNQSPVMQQVQIQVNQFQTEIASLNVRAKNYSDDIVALESQIHILPEIEAERIALNRGYSIIKGKHTQLLSRRETAQLAQQADETTDKINFRVIDPPRAPSKPAGPMRYVLFGVVMVLGIGVGIGLSLLMSLLNPVVTSSVQLSKATGIPIFGVVSANENLGLQRWHRRKTLIFMASNMVLLGVLILFVSYFMFPSLIQAPLQRIL